ncbi:MAG: DUF3667 domain-containing protein [Salinibacter sp.]
MPDDTDEPNPDEVVESIAEPTECPNCGRVFSGTYCPDCGQEADPSASVTSVIGGFFRELVDMESGFWPTLVGLTLRPGQVLRRYLEGARAGLASPGRYLLTVVIVSVGIDRLLAWGGVTGDPFRISVPADDDLSSSTAVGDALAESLLTALQQWMQVLGPQIRTIAVLLAAVLLAVLLSRLFGGQVQQAGEALALGCFLSAHVEVLGLGIGLLYEPAVFVYTGQPAESPLLLPVALQVGYIGYAAHRCFGPGWRPAVKGAFAGGWALLEAMSIAFTGVVVHAAWLALARFKEHGGVEGASGKLIGVATALGVVCALPLLLHAAVEAYSRLR